MGVLDVLGAVVSLAGTFAWMAVMAGTRVLGAVVVIGLRNNRPLRPPGLWLKISGLIPALRCSFAICGVWDSTSLSSQERK